MNSQLIKGVYRGLTTVLLLCLALPTVSLSHSGRTDSLGGHTNRKTGEYHYHGTSKAKVSSEISSGAQKSYQSTYTPTEIERRIYSYFRDANEGVGALDCRVTKTDRDVSAGTKRFIKRRDGHRCVICGSTHKLEVDHIRALMNGGSNSTSNLATLCDDCHTAKTRLDSSLRRKRKRVCR